MSDLDTALDYVIVSEGPEVNRSPDEPGGISKYGVSLEAYRDWKDGSQDTIANLTEADAREFYTEVFAKGIRFDELPSGVNYRLFDISISLGLVGAIELVELIMLRFPLGGKLDDVLLADIKGMDPKTVINLLSTAWICTKRGQGWAKYGHGWSNRNAAATIQALAMVK